MRLLSTAIIASGTAAVVAYKVLDFDIFGTITSYAVSGQVILGAALVAAIVLDTKT